jgi:MFS transporter, DHA2 family, multidrug resistance protein
MSAVAIGHSEQPSRQGLMLWIGGMVLALANFVAVLNMTIAKVTVPNMAGALGAGSSPAPG